MIFKNIRLYPFLGLLMVGFSGVLNRSSAVAYNEGLRKYMLGVYNFMTVALGLSGIVALLVVKSGAVVFFANPIVSLVMILAEVGIVLYLSSKLMSIDNHTAKTLFFTYAALNGAVLSVIFLMYSGVDIARAFLTTTLTFGTMSIYGYVTKKDLSQYSSLVMMIAFGLIITSLINIFLRSSGLEFLVSLIGVALFTFLIAFDTQKIKEIYYHSSGNTEARSKMAIYGALTLYMDFVNLFIYMLRFLSIANSRNRD